MPPASERSAGVRRLRVADLPEVRNAARASGRIGNWVEASGVRRQESAFRIGVVFLILALAACNTRKAPQQAIAYAFAGPNNLNLRKDLGPRAPVVGAAHHGEKLEVLEVRRRFAKVRTSTGTEGWTDTTNLLTQQQMGGLWTRAASAAKVPSQGKGTGVDWPNM